MEVVQFSPEIILGDPGASHIIAQYHRNIVGNRRLRTVNDTFKYHIAVKLFHFGSISNGTIEQCIRKRRRQCSTQKCIVFLKKRYHLFVRFCTVFDRVYPILQSNFYPLRRLHMSRYLISHGMRFITDCLYHFGSHF